MHLSGPRLVLGGTVAVLVTVAAVVAGIVLVRGPASPSGTTPAAPAARIAPAAGRVDVTRAVESLAVLRDWDRARAGAWAKGDVAALRALYLPGSRAGRRDVAMLRSWLARGLRVEGMRTQVLGVELRRRTGRRIVLVVTDRLAEATAVRSGGSGGSGRVDRPDRFALPRDGPSTRRLEFRRVGERWLLASVRE